MGNRLRPCGYVPNKCTKWGFIHTRFLTSDGRKYKRQVLCKDHADALNIPRYQDFDLTKR